MVFPYILRLPFPSLHEEHQNVLLYNPQLPARSGSESPTSSQLPHTLFSPGLQETLHHWDVFVWHTNTQMKCRLPLCRLFMLPVACLRDTHRKLKIFIKSGLRRINQYSTSQTRKDDLPVATRTNNTHIMSNAHLLKFADLLLATRKLTRPGPRRHCNAQEASTYWAKSLVMNTYLERIRKICRPTAGINLSGSTQSFSQDGTHGKRVTFNPRNHRNTSQPLTTWRKQSFIN